jgi:RNA polymerase sigma factor FliA
MLNPSTSPTSPTPRSGARMTDDLARRYLARVIVHARWMARRLPPHIALNDLISAGLLGAVEGFLRFDPDRAETLDAYLDHRIRGAMLDELRRADPLTRAERDFARRLRRATQAAGNDSSDARDDSLATALGLSLAEFRSRVAQVQVAVPLQGVGSEERTADESLRPDDEASQQEERRRLAAATERLRPRERELLRLRYEEGQSFREIGDRFRISESRVSQLHAHAIQNLRALL